MIRSRKYIRCLNLWPPPGKTKHAQKTSIFTIFYNLFCGVRILYVSLKYMHGCPACLEDYGQLPDSAVADGGYASQANVSDARAKGVKRAVFNKPVGLSYHQMGVKKKTFDKLRNFRAGVEGNILELKRAFGMSKATWKGLEGFKAFVWSSVLSYNLIRMSTSVRHSSTRSEREALIQPFLTGLMQSMLVIWQNH